MSRRVQIGLIWTIALVVVAVIALWPESSPATAQPTLATTPAPTIDQVGVGKALFVAKGCVGCHVHRDVNTRSISVGPDLSIYSGDPVFLRQWLADPAKLRPNTTMPDLDLSEAEIDALIAFLLQPTR